MGRSEEEELGGQVFLSAVVGACVSFACQAEPAEFWTQK